MIDIRQPNITAQTDREQLLQMRSYLYQLSQQLQWAFNTIDASGGSGTASGTVSGVPVSAGTTDTSNTFAEIKDLIIKSADIVNAYYMQINKRLEGQYVAQSDFGKYSEKTAQDIVENSTSINQIFSNLRETSDLVETLYASSVNTNAYIKTGLLYEDEHGIPVYGLEVGQTNDVNGENVFTKFARFRSDRLSFYDRNDTEVAYVSDYKLYITNAEITGSLRLADKFKIYYNNGLAFQWIGVSS